MTVIWYTGKPTSKGDIFSHPFQKPLLLINQLIQSTFRTLTNTDSFMRKFLTVKASTVSAKKTATEVWQSSQNFSGIWFHKRTTQAKCWVNFPCNLKVFDHECHGQTSTFPLSCLTQFSWNFGNWKTHITLWKKKKNRFL